MTTSDALALHRPRRALLLIAVLVSAALLVTVFSTHRQVRAGLTSMARGQGEAWLANVQRATRPEVPWDQTTLEELLTFGRDAGLVCIAVFGPDPETTSAGDCPGELRAALRSTQQGSAVGVGDRLRMVSHPPPHGPARADDPDRPHRRPEDFDLREGPRPDDGRRPPPHLRDPSGRRRPPPRRPPRESTLDDDRTDPARRPAPPPDDGRAGPRPILIEYVPRATQALGSAARQTLAVGLVAALALLGTAVAFSRLALRAQRVQTERAQERHLASLGEMSAVLAHEIRNPLASMKGHAQLLVEQLPETGRERAKAERVAHEVIRLERLVDDLLSFARSPSLRCHSVDPAALMRQAIEAVDAPRLELIADRAPKRWSLDSDRMQQVLQNLLRNAIQASPSGATATVTVRSGRLVFTVRDHGDGIAPGEEESIFEPFQTTRVRGTGLGLAVARRIVQLHHGTIRAGNHADGGAVFTIEIPPSTDVERL